MRRVESWYVSYALLGLSAAGLMPILLPILVGRSGDAADVGLVMASFSLGGLTAPLWGRWADRYRLHRGLLAGGLLATAAGAVAFTVAESLVARTGSALLSGIGLAAASTVANLLVVEAHPREEWDSRIGALLAFYGGGQVCGLVLAGLIGPAAPSRGLRLAAAVSAVAVVPVLLATRRRPVPLAESRPVFSHAPSHAEWPIGSPRHASHHPGPSRLGTVLREMESRLTRFFAAWLLGYAGSAASFALYPVLMRKLYGVPAALSSAGYAVAAGLGLALYAPAGRWSEKRGPRRVLRYGLAVRLLAFAAMLGLARVTGPGRGWLALSLFVAVVLAWPLLSVSGTALVAELASGDEGEAMGAFNAVTAVSGVAGASLGGWAASALGYAAVPAMGLAGAALGLLILSVGFPGRSGAPAREEASS